MPLLLPAVQQFENLLRPTNELKGGLLHMATQVAKRCGLVWKDFVRGFEPWANTKTKSNLKACERSCYGKVATYAWQMNTNGVTVDDMAEWEALFQRRSNLRC